jgi:acyl-coenzyme A thioesterase PaaI-like protein
MNIEKLSQIEQFLKTVYEERVPFHRLLQLKIKFFNKNSVGIKIQSRKELFGNYRYEMLHGGVIASILDTTSSAIVSLGLDKKIIYKPFEDIKERIFKISTIDLRIDYLEAGQGNFFMATGSLLRIGNKVASVQTYLKNNKDVLIAAGTGTYMLAK